MPLHTGRRPAAALIGALALAVVASSLPTSIIRVFATPQAARPSRAGHALLGAVKPSFRVDAANTGRLTTAGPATRPSESFEVFAQSAYEQLDGIQVDSQGNLIASSSEGNVYSFSPSGGLNWRGLTDTPGDNNTCSLPSPALSNDGTTYMPGASSLYQIDPSSAALPGLILTGPTFLPLVVPFPWHQLLEPITPSMWATRAATSTRSLRPPRVRGIVPRRSGYSRQPAQPKPLASLREPNRRHLQILRAGRPWPGWDDLRGQQRHQSECRNAKPWHAICPQTGRRLGALERAATRCRDQCGGI